jgi:hypothetical protein
MNNILKFDEYYDWQEIANDFLFQIKNSPLRESDENDNQEYSSLIKNILNKFGFNLSLVLTFGTGVKLMFPIIAKLIENMQLEIKPTKEDIVLLCITCISIMYLENKKEAPIQATDIKNKLNAEIQMKFGNPRIIVNKILKCFEHLFIFIKKFPKLFGVSVNNIIDMFAYTAILQPIMNAISAFIGTYNITPDTLAGNLLSLGTGVATISGKSLLNFLTNNNKKNKSGEDVLSDVEDLTDMEQDGNVLIKEQ